MPAYDYECRECRLVQEQHHHITETPFYDCPSCGQQMRKKMNAVATHFKGGGWGGSHPAKMYKTRSHADAGTGEIGSQTTEEIGPGLKKS